jgi:trans-2,3-dihydro-3-hydroxyanthranilate isomerase
MPHTFQILDVFAETPFAGNQLAVVFDADGLSDERMQAIAREFNFSETTFVLTPNADRHRARVRIFTPVNELPFAGHPTIGTAGALALKDGREAAAFGMELIAGVVACVATRHDARTADVRFRTPRLPEALDRTLSAEDAAAALNLSTEDIGVHRHAISHFSAGVPYDIVPVASLDALSRAKPNAAFSRVFRGSHPSAYLYTRTGEASFRARMFAPDLGVPEDPATGSAAASFAGALMRFERFADGTHDVVIEQGVEMGRPSRILLQLIVEQGLLIGVELGGRAIVMAEGRLMD